MKKLGDWIPAPVRQVIYSVLGAAWLLEQIWDAVPEPLEGKVLKSLTVLGFGLAFTQTSD